MIIIDTFAPNPWTTYNGSFTTRNGDLWITATGMSLMARTGEVFPPDQFSEAVISANKPAGAGLQVFVRRNVATLERYGFGVYAASGVTYWSLKRDGGPVGIYLWGPSPGPAVVAGDVIKIEAVGSLISGYLNGQLMRSVADTVLSSGAPGIAGKNSGLPVPLALVSEWRGGSVP